MSERFYTILKVLGCIALLCFVVPIRISNDNLPTEQFNEYLKQFNKTYTNKTEYLLRLQIFQKSLNKITELNANRTNNSAYYGLTKFSDMSSDEFLNNHLQTNLKKPTNSREIDDSREDMSDEEHTKKIFSKRASVPEKFDWRLKGVVTEIKNQNACGACWAFCVVENFETMNALKTGVTENLSVQQMIDCAGYDNSGCNGGDMCTLMQWIKDNKVPVLKEDNYPLRLKNEQCKMKNATGIRIDDFQCNNMVDHEDIILQAISTKGPVAVAINAISWQHYLGGVIQFHCNGSPMLLNHAVQIVGYDLTADIPHYIVRNSWGKDFGDAGYLYVAIGKNMCGIANEVTILNVL